jgi:hypothetical protein
MNVGETYGISCAGDSAQEMQSEIKSKSELNIGLARFIVWQTTNLLFGIEHYFIVRILQPSTGSKHLKGYA